MIPLFDLSGHNRYGGFVTFAIHLFRGLYHAGYDPVLFRPANVNEKLARTYAGGIPYYNLRLENMVGYARSGVILASQWKETRTETLAMLEAGAGIFLHDPNEYAKNTELVGWLQAHPKTRIWVIREANRSNLKALGLSAALLPHPYQRLGMQFLPLVERPYHALSLSRIDHDKHIDLIADANQLLPPQETVQIYGFDHRVYAHHTLDVKHPHWRRYYCGAFPREFGTAVKMAGQRRFLVDMSIIPNDGGGTQYTFLEAWNAGCAVVLNEHWKRAGDEITDNEAYFVNTADELANVLHLADPQAKAKAGQALLHKHDAVIVAHQFMEQFNG